MKLKVGEDGNGGSNLVLNFKGLKPGFVRTIIAGMLLLAGGAPVGSYFGGTAVVTSEVEKALVEVRYQVKRLGDNSERNGRLFEAHRKALLLISDQNRMIAKKLNIEGFSDLTIILDEQLHK